MPDAGPRHELGTAPALGLAIGPAAWFVAQQAGFTLASFGCRMGKGSLPLAVQLAALLATLIGAWLCWRRWRHPATPGPALGSARAERNFAAGLGAMLNGLMALAIVYQGLATLFLSGCER